MASHTNIETLNLAQRAVTLDLAKASRATVPDELVKRAVILETDLRRLAASGEMTPELLAVINFRFEQIAQA